MVNVERTIIAVSAVMKRLLEDVDQAAKGTAPIHITGETGTGKELIARRIHARSAGATGPFVAVDLAALAPDKLDSVLFGVAEGSFTDVKSSPGVFERADGGTLFIDEIGNLGTESQPKLLRVLREREVERMHSGRLIAVNVRLVSATLVDLWAAVEAGTFREDLCYRLLGHRFELPPLRERAEDIVHIAKLYAGARTLTAAAEARLLAHSWPGNVGELRSVIEVACDRARSPTTIDAGDIIHRTARVVTSRSQPVGLAEPAVFTEPLRRALAALEAAWDEVLDPPSGAGGLRDQAAPSARIRTLLARFAERMRLDPAAWRPLLDPDFQPRRMGKGQVIPRIDNGTAAWLFRLSFAAHCGEKEAEKAPEPEWLGATLLDQMIRRYRATLTQFFVPDVPWLVPFKVKTEVKTDTEQQTFVDVLDWVNKRLDKARPPMYVRYGADRVRFEEQAATRGFLSAEACDATHGQIDAPKMRAERFKALSRAGGALKILDSVGLPFVEQHLPDHYRPVSPGQRTFAYDVVRGPHEATWFQLPPELRASRRERLRELAASMRIRGSVFDNGQDLAALHSVERNDAGFRFRFHRVTYFDYVMANMMAPLDADQSLVDPGHAPERVWSQPRGAFFGLSALVVTADDYVVMQVRDALPAADQMTLNASISGGMDIADLDHPHPLEAGLLREGTSEISKLLAHGVSQGAQLTYLGWVRNAHRRYLPELAWLVKLEHTSVDAWVQSENAAGLNSWRSLARQAPESFETADERMPRTGEVWMPSLLFVRRSKLLAHARQILDVNNLPTCDPRKQGFRWHDEAPFGWLPHCKRTPWSLGHAESEVHTTLDSDNRFNDTRWYHAANGLALRQPALPFLSTLGLYVRMLERTGALGGSA